MNLPAVFRRRARDDLTAAYDWYEELKPALGAEFLSAVLSTFESIEHHPEMFAFVHADVRRAVVARFPFAVFYSVEPKRVVILRVLHSARNPKLWPRPKR